MYRKPRLPAEPMAPFSPCSSPSSSSSAHTSCEKASSRSPRVTEVSSPRWSSKTLSAHSAWSMFKRLCCGLVAVLLTTGRVRRTRANHALCGLRCVDPVFKWPEMRETATVVRLRWPRWFPPIFQAHSHPEMGQEARVREWKQDGTVSVAPTCLLKGYSPREEDPLKERATGPRLYSPAKESTRQPRAFSEKQRVQNVFSSSPSLLRRAVLVPFHPSSKGGSCNSCNKSGSIDK